MEEIEGSRVRFLKKRKTRRETIKSCVKNMPADLLTCSGTHGSA